MYGQRGFYLNRKFKTASSEGTNIVRVGDNEIGAYVSFDLNKFLYWTSYNIEASRHNKVISHHGKLEYKCSTVGEVSKWELGR